MTTIQSTIAIPDQFAALPPRCRRGGGRSHELHWSASEPSVFDTGKGSLTFSARSINPETQVTFGRRRLTFSFLSVKTATAQQGDGPWEYQLAKELEVDPAKPTYQLHNVEATWSNGSAVLQRYRPDATWADVDGLITVAEVKASAGYFADPGTRSLCDAAEKGLAGMSVRFARVTGDDLQQDRRRAYNISRAFADRLTALSPRQIGAARDQLAGGEVALGRLAEVLGASRASAVQCVNALMVRRHASYDLCAPVTPDLPVGMPPPVSRAADLAAIGA